MISVNDHFSDRMLLPSNSSPFFVSFDTIPLQNVIVCNKTSYQEDTFQLLKMICYDPSQTHEQGQITAGTVAESHKDQQKCIHAQN